MTHLYKSISLLFLIAFIYITPIYAQLDPSKVYVVGSDYAYYPYEYINEFHEPDGFDIDIIRAIANEIGIDISIETGNWFRIKKKLEDGNIDMVAGMYYLPDRAEKFNFSMPFIIITHSIFAKDGDYWQSLKDVRDNNKIKVVVENSSILHKYLTTAGISSSRILPVENQLDALKILTETPNTCALLPELQGKYIAKKHGFKNIHTVGLPILPREYSVAVTKNDTVLLNQVNDAITEIHKNGTYTKIYNKWFGDFKEYQSNFYSSYIYEILVTFGFIILAILYLLSFFRWRNILQKKDLELESETLEKDQLNATLLRSENTLRKITENTPYPISIINSEGNFIYVNRVFEDELGYTRNEIKNLNNWFNLFFSNHVDKNKIKEQFENILLDLKTNNSQEKSINNLSIKGKHKESNIYKVRIISLEDGQVLFFYENNTERIDYEEKLKEAIQKAESADKLKSSFLANISHEIRTPMNAILGFSSLITESGLTIEDKNTYSSLIKKNGNVLMMLIQDIIDFSKIEAGKLNIYPQLANVVDLLNDAYYIIKEDFSLKIPHPIEFIYRFPEDSDLNNLFIRVDPNRFSQVINNLLTNAFKYTDKGKVEFSLVKLSNSKIRISIKDTGIGIKKEHHSLIFNRFSRVESKEVQIRGGTGLGLAIAYQILKLFGTELMLDSQVGIGSHFYFDLPYYEGMGEKVDNQAFESTGTKKEYNWKGKHILIVEDNNENAFYLKSILDNTKCSYEVCSTGEEVESLLDKLERIDLVLLDWLLPDTGGEHLVNKIKSKFNNTPIIVVTALALIEDKIEIMENNVDGYLPKPIDKDVLLEKINRIIN